MRNSGSSTFREPFVPNDKRQRRKRREKEIELTTRQQYRPPDLQAPIVHGRTLERPTRIPPTIVPASAPFVSSHNTVLKQDNPAKDLAWDCCSHGCFCIQCVRTQEIGISENCGSFDGIVGPGLYCGVWPCSGVVSRLSLRVQQLDITIETKTKDDVFLFVTVSVQFRVFAPLAYDAYYSLADTDRQIRTYVYDVIRSTIPRMDLDHVFTSKTEIADTVFTRLQSLMKNYGYEIVSTLVLRISPNEHVKFSMNEVNVSKRLKEAIPYRAEAEKFAKVKEAESKAETLYLLGVGTARQRSAIAQGLKSSLIDCSKDQTAGDAMDLLLAAQYLDTLAAVGAEEVIIRNAPSEIVAIRKSLPKQKPPPDLLWD